MLLMRRLLLLVRRRWRLLRMLLWILDRIRWMWRMKRLLLR